MLTWLFAAGVVTIDQLTKALAAAGALTGAGVRPTTNPDFALGVAGASTEVELALGLAVLAVNLRVVRSRRGRGRMAAVAPGLVLGGSIGNLLDRALIGEVRDFLVGPGLIYNLADIALLVGLGCLLVTAGRTGSRSGPERDGAGQLHRQPTPGCSAVRLAGAAIRPGMPRPGGGEGR